ncbi:hypothetical protein AB0L49_02405 [Streptomyces antimycoticus]|uniref:hypothetical protein n=1 Tax=Streptomyces antimycoticus TaxID=68175 RepID=UPI0034358EB5
MSDSEIYEIHHEDGTSHIAVSKGTSRAEAEQLAARAREAAKAALAANQPDVEYVAREISGYDTDCRVIATLPKAQADAMTEEELTAWDAERRGELAVQDQEQPDVAPGSEDYVTRVRVEGDRRMIAVLKKGASDQVTDQELFGDLEAWAAEQGGHDGHLRAVEDPDDV